MSTPFLVAILILVSVMLNPKYVRPKLTEAWRSFSFKGADICPTLVWQRSNVKWNVSYCCRQDNFGLALFKPSILWV